MRSISTTSSTTPSALMSTNLINNKYNTNTSTLNSNNSSMNNNNNNMQRLDWESLRKQARQLENEIDSKLVGFSKLCSNYTTSNRNVSSLSSAPSTSSTSSSSLSSSSSSDLLFITLSNEIEEALKKLTLINGKMSDSLNSDMNNSSATVHTLQRHRDILRDYTHEYEKTKRNIISYKEREKLLTTPTSRTVNETNLNNRRSDNGSNNANDGSTSFYMKEYDHIKNSHSLIDQQLEIAELTKENLQSQRQSLRLIQQKMNTLAHKFPLINNLVQRVKLKKRKDSIILALVISACLIIMILYLF